MGGGGGGGKELYKMYIIAVWSSSTCTHTMMNRQVLDMATLHVHVYVYLHCVLYSITQLARPCTH